MPEPEYDVPTQIEALEHLHGRFPAAGLVVLGSGSLDEELRRRVGASPRARDVLLCGDLAHVVAIGAVSRSDVFLRTTLYEGDSVSLREALHFGVPVVATDVGVRPEGVELVAARDPAGVAEAVVRCLGRSDRRPRAPQDGEEGLRAMLALYEELA
jgi:glycosyltransferase involved in cell wall biosynthesis